MGSKRGSIDSAASPPSAKRIKTGADPLSLLIDNVDDLRKCLKSLKKSQEAQDEQLTLDTLPSPIKEQLTSLGTALAPAFASLAGLEKRNEALPHQLDISAGSSTSNTIGAASSASASSTHSLPTIIPSTSFTKWTSSEIKATPVPPLPTGLDPALERMALTHSGAAGKLEHSYDYLEWLGDVYLELIASSHIYVTFPKTSPGKASQLREMLIRNTTLAEYTRMYELDRRAVLPEPFWPKPPQNVIPAKEKERVKVLGDLFEAFVGAVVLSSEDGAAKATRWLKALWGPKILEQVQIEESRQESQLQRHSSSTQWPVEGAASSATGPPADASRKPDSTPKEQLARMLAMISKGITLRYEDVQQKKAKLDKVTKLATFTVAVYLDGWGKTNVELGRGTALGKKEAGQMAAKNAMHYNQKLVKEYAEKKLRYLASLSLGKPDAE